MAGGTGGVLFALVRLLVPMLETVELLALLAKVVVDRTQLRLTLPTPVLLLLLLLPTINNLPLVLLHHARMVLLAPVVLIAQLSHNTEYLFVALATEERDVVTPRTQVTKVAYFLVVHGRGKYYKETFLPFAKTGTGKGKSRHDGTIIAYGFTS